MGTTIVSNDGILTIPSYVTDINGFRRWAHSDEFPEQGQFWWLRGHLWVDMSNEQIFWHVGVKTEITIVVGGLVKHGKLGRYLTDGVLVSNFAADISGNPDSLFLSNETLGSDRVRLIEGKDGGYRELQGSPDMVLEVVSPGSVQKDTVVLKAGYFEAGVTEYWLIDVRRDLLQFDIFRRGKNGFIATRKQDGWLRSQVFGHSFRLRQETGGDGHPEYTLEVR